jgi:hypothetical protein
MTVIWNQNAAGPFGFANVEDAVIRVVGQARRRGRWAEPRWRVLRCSWTVRVKIALLAALALLVLAWQQVGAQVTNSRRAFIPVTARNSSVSEGLLVTPTRVPLPTSVPLPTATPTITPTATPAPIALRLATYSSRRSGAYTYVYVKLENVGTTAVYDARVTATFRNASGAITGVEDGGANLSMLRPGEFSTVTIFAQPAADSTTYDLASSARTSSFTVYLHNGIDVDSLNTYRTGSQVFVVGRVTNNTLRTLRSLRLDVGIYGPDGTILDASTEFPFQVGDDVPAGASANFSVSFFDFENPIPAGYTYSVRPEGYLP